MRRCVITSSALCFRGTYPLNWGPFNSRLQSEVSQSHLSLIRINLWLCGLSNVGPRGQASGLMLPRAPPKSLDISLVALA